MSDFTMPSDEARALNPDLDRACIELEKEREMREAATVSLKDMTFWVEGALKCTAWHWDMDQHEAATWCLDEAKKVLEGANTEAAAYQAKMQRLMQAARNLRIAVAGDQPGDEPNVCADCQLLGAKASELVT